MVVCDAAKNGSMDRSIAVFIGQNDRTVITFAQSDTENFDDADQRSGRRMKRTDTFSHAFHNHSMPTGDTLCAVGLICSRIGCREKAAASLQFDAERSTAILIDLTHARNGMPLCERHASSRTAPVGWQMVDRRTGARKLEIWSAEDEGRPAPAFAVPTERPSTKRPADPQSRRAEDTEVEEPVAAEPAPAVPTERPAARRPQPEPKPEPAPEPVAKEQPAAEEGFRWPKQGDEDPEEAGPPKKDLAADSPLLSRAFRAAK